MTKEEKIKKAWDDTGIKGVVYNENGWAEFNIGFKKHPCYDPEKFDFTSIKYFRPKPLKGIENNNGWTKIETEDDLPVENGYYWVRYKNEKTWMVFLEGRNEMTDTKKDTLLNHYTHYAPAHKPDDPTY